MYAIIRDIFRDIHTYIYILIGLPILWTTVIRYLLKPIMNLPRIGRESKNETKLKRNLQFLGDMLGQLVEWLSDYEQDVIYTLRKDLIDLKWRVEEVVLPFVECQSLNEEEICCSLRKLSQIIDPKLKKKASNAIEQIIESFNNPYHTEKVKSVARKCLEELKTVNKKDSNKTTQNAGESKER
jgi:hypothetical protein